MLVVLGLLGFKVGAAKRDSMIGMPFEALQQMSIFAPLIVLGVFAATLSSSLGSFLGAPRILQAMGQDRLMGVMVFFGKGSGATNEPRRATVLTFILAIGVIWAGDLNAVAEVISMFQTAWADLEADDNATKDMFDEANNLGCPI